KVVFDKNRIDRLPSAAVVRGSESYGENYSFDLAHWTEEPPRHRLGFGARLLLFITRKKGVENKVAPKRPVTLLGVKLRSKNGKLLKAFRRSKNPSPVDSRRGIARYSLELDPGG